MKTLSAGNSPVSGMAECAKAVKCWYDTLSLLKGQIGGAYFFPALRIITYLLSLLRQKIWKVCVQDFDLVCKGLDLVPFELEQEFKHQSPTLTWAFWSVGLYLLCSEKMGHFPQGGCRCLISAEMAWAELSSASSGDKISSCRSQRYCRQVQPLPTYRSTTEWFG